MLIRPLPLAYKELLTSGAVFKKYGRQGSPHMRFVWLTENQRESTARRSRDAIFGQKRVH